jgi:hypothetical protein
MKTLQKREKFSWNQWELNTKEIHEASKNKLHSLMHNKRKSLKQRTYLTLIKIKSSI